MWIWTYNEHNFLISKHKPEWVGMPLKSINIFYNWRPVWYNGYCQRKWTRQDSFYFVLMPLWEARIHPFSLLYD